MLKILGQPTRVLCNQLLQAPLRHPARTPFSLPPPPADRLPTPKCTAGSLHRATAHPLPSPGKPSCLSAPTSQTTVTGSAPTLIIGPVTSACM